MQKLVDTYLTAKYDLEPVEVGKLLGRARKGLVKVVDVRPREEYLAGHLPGAVNIPLLSQLESRLGSLPKNREIVAYCRGPYCVLAFEAVARLHRKGWEVRRLADGYPEWRLRVCLSRRDELLAFSGGQIPGELQLQQLQPLHLA